MHRVSDLIWQNRYHEEGATKVDRVFRFSNNLLKLRKDLDERNIDGARKVAPFPHSKYSIVWSASIVCSEPDELFLVRKRQ